MLFVFLTLLLALSRSLFLSIASNMDRFLSDWPFSFYKSEKWHAQTCKTIQMRLWAIYLMRFYSYFFFISNHSSKFAYELQTIKIIVWLPFDFDWRACVHLQTVREFIVIIWSTVFIWYSTKKNVQLYAVKGQQRWPCSLINMLCMSRRALKKLSRFIR